MDNESPVVVEAEYNRDNYSNDESPVVVVVEEGYCSGSGRGRGRAICWGRGRCRAGGGSGCADGCAPC